MNYSDKFKQTLYTYPATTKLLRTIELKVVTKQQQTCELTDCPNLSDEGCHNSENYNILNGKRNT